MIKYNESLMYLGQTDDDRVSMRDCWANALGIARDLVPLALAQLVTLIPSIEAAATAEGPARLASTIRAYSPAWFAILSPIDQGIDGKAPYVSEAALVGLNILAALGEETQVQELPVQRIGAIREAILDSLTAVRLDLTLNADLRSLIQTRLSDMLWAVDHVSFTGAEGVRAAAERLAASLAMAKKEERTKTSFHKAIIAGCLAWTIFSHGTDVHDNLAAWANMLPEASTVIHQVEGAVNGAMEVEKIAIETARDIVDAEIVDMEN